jgi:HlyD family secretion protein
LLLFWTSQSLRAADKRKAASGFQRLLFVDRMMGGVKMIASVNQLPTTVPAGDRKPATSAAQGKSGPARPAPKRKVKTGKWLLLAVIVAGSIAGYFVWKSMQPPKLPDGFASSNGRIEATEIDVATKLGERIKDELVDEGDFVTTGQELAHMNIQVLEAELSEANAKLGVAASAVDTAKSTLVQRESEKAAAEAAVTQREADLERATEDFQRAKQLVVKRAMSEEDYDARKAAFFGAKGGLASANANVAAADAAISTAKALIIASKANVESTQATIERIEADIKDSTLRAPRDCRVQYRVAQPGEVLSAGVGVADEILDVGQVGVGTIAAEVGPQRRIKIFGVLGHHRLQGGQSGDRSERKLRAPAEEAK